jgi:hypothetical protein
VRLQAKALSIVGIAPKITSARFYWRRKEVRRILQTVLENAGKETFLLQGATSRDITC